MLQRDEENDYLTEDAFETDALTPLHSASITYRIPLGPQQGRKVSSFRSWFRAIPENSFELDCG